MVKKLLGIAVVLLVLAVAGAAAWRLRSREIPRETVSGTIEVDETRVASRYGGRVVKLHVREGDAVKAGQPLLDLEAAELRARRDQAGAMLAELEAGPRKEEITAARAEAEALEAELALARQEERRASGLFKDKVISAAELDRPASRVQVLDKSLVAAKSRHELLLAGTRPERLAMARAQIAELDANLAETRLVAPDAAVVEVLNVKPGDVLAPNREAATLLLTNHLWLRVFVPEPWLAHVQVGQAVKVRVDGISDREFDGAVEQIQRQAEFTPRNAQTTEERIKQVFGVKLRLDPRQGLLRAGMSADVWFPNVPARKAQ